MIKLFFFCCIILPLSGCRQVYEPPVIKSGNNFLVLDGFINSTGSSVTEISLSRTRNLSDTGGMQPERNAILNIESNSGASFKLLEFKPGIYSGQLTLNSNDLYRLRINTSNGSQYLSDFVPVKKSSPIDSLTWKQDKDVSIYASSHDPLNQSVYYKWDYSDTWEYHSAIETIWGVDNGLLFYRDTDRQIYRCWSNALSTDIFLGTTFGLSQDNMQHALVAMVTQGSPKISVRYSILVNQRVLTKEAYEFWQTLQKNTQQLGSLFDPQPSQLKSNIHCISNPAEPVMGFLSAGSVENKRIFIDHREVKDWVEVNPVVPECRTKQIDSNFPYYNYPDTSYVPYYFSGPILFIIPNGCVNCLLYGGSNKKPVFW